MRPSRSKETSLRAVPADVRAKVMPAVLDELARWGVERFSIEALAERHRLDVAMIYQYWGDRQHLIVDAAVRDAEALRTATDTGALQTDLLALARCIAADCNTRIGRTFHRSLVMDSRGHHDTETRMLFWQQRFSIIRAIVDRARQRGEVRDGVNTLAAIQIVTSPLYIRSLYTEDPVDDSYCVAIADLAWHALRKQ
ncbi:TetR family transcriptional regulator [Mycobacterium asiaticum]|uniref:TetR family transcriptional regulator n=1 Tax=Mycobacterium asiaticum TaxID=1790 RepID=A0A1A3NHU9_MYCAS|nr:TetR-like C-terminal domain-containing protein [Mycobacterium asiaticum]OBK20634.1 TetR family transcriptional regulator [Mycobacterium asiaticum]